MFSFFKKNWGIMVRLLLNQIAFSLFSIMMITFRVLANHPAVDFIVGMFCVIFYLFVQYVTIWTEAGKDRVRVDAGHDTRVSYKGLWIALGANIPNVILVILSTVGRLTGNGYLQVCTVIYTVIQQMYSGLITLFSPNNPIGHILIILPAIVVITIGYEFGYRNFRIGSLFGIKEKKRK